MDTLVGDVDGKNVIVLDDEIANGGTIVEVLRKLRERRVKRIAVAWHARPFHGTKPFARWLGLTSRKLSRPILYRFLLKKRLPNMKILSIAPLLAEAIRRIHVGESVSVLFDA